MDRVCEHVEALDRARRELGIRIYSEDGEGGWVNIYCAKCMTTFETNILKKDANDEPGNTL